jgi:NADPH:quinone reductase-like Zn-dependent oxidoreductase
MKAIVYTNYGSPDVLKFTEIQQPVAEGNKVLIRVHAASINSWDWDMVRGKPYIVRIGGLRTPRYRIPGADLAGVVESTGPEVKKLKVGDRVFGDLCASGWGAYAEYVCAPETVLSIIPANISFSQAAALPQAGVMALQGIRDMAQVIAETKVLINGAGGGVGTLAVQLAKMYGAEVTAVDSSIKLDMLRSIGADHLIDYKTEDFTANGQKYDLILDVVANRTLSQYRRSLNSGGRFIMVGGTASSIIETMFFGTLVSKLSGRKLGLLMHKPNKNLAELADLVSARKITPVIRKEFGLHETPEAMRYFGSGRAEGKVIITMNPAT